MFCDKCGMQLEEGAVFCPGCGNQIGSVDPSEEKTIILGKEEESAPKAQTAVAVTPAPSKIKYCHSCGVANAETDAFCYACGASFDGKTKNKVKKSEGKEKKSIGGSKFSKLAIGLAVVVVIVAVAAFLGGRSGKKMPLIYLKDNEITAWAKDKRTVYGDSAYSRKYEGINGINNCQSYIKVSEDGRYVFFPQDIGEDGYDLYYYDRKKDDSGRIDTNVTSYYTLLKDNRVVYRKDNSEKKLYVSGMEEKEKIASDVSDYYVSEDEKEILWTIWEENEGYKVYVSDLAGKTEKQKIDSGINSLTYVSEDLQDIIYTKEDVLYYVKNFGEKQKIDSDVERVRVISGKETEVYYLVEADSYDLNNLVEDDLAETDATIREPRIEDYQRTEVKPSFWGDRNMTVTDDAYYAELEKYEKKAHRDDIREELSEDDMSAYVIYRYVPGMEEPVEFSKGLITGLDNSQSVLIYQKVEEEKIEKIKMSDLDALDNLYEVMDEMEENMEKATSVYMVRNGEATELELDPEYQYYLYGENENLKECYFVAEDNDDDDSLYKVNYEKMDGTLEFLADNFSHVELYAEGATYYMTDYEDGMGELYCNDSKVASDVSSGSVEEMRNKKGVLYIEDPNENDVGTLKWFDTAESIRIADDVADYVSNEKGNVAFLTDYSFNKNRGQLKVFDGKESNSIGLDVTAILYY